MHFCIPPGFPGATPNTSFWCDPDLNVHGYDKTMKSPMGADWRPHPVHPTGVQKDGGFGRYFRLHVQHWNPNHDTLYTVAKVIDLRLQRVA